MLAHRIRNLCREKGVWLSNDGPNLVVEWGDDGPDPELLAEIDQHRERLQAIVAREQMEWELERFIALCRYTATAGLRV